MAWGGVPWSRGGVPTARSLGPAPTQRGPQGPVSSLAAVSPLPGSAPYGSPLSPGHRPFPSDPCHSPRDALVPLSPPGTGQGSPAPTGCARGRRLAPWRPGIRHLQPGGWEGPRGTSRRSQAWRPQRRVNLSEAGDRPRPAPPVAGSRRDQSPPSSALPFCSGPGWRPRCLPTPGRAAYLLGSLIQTLISSRSTLRKNIPQISFTLSAAWPAQAEM